MGSFGRRQAYASAPNAFGESHQSGHRPPPWAGWFNCGRANAEPSSGNRAFDEYRLDTLRRLEEEQLAFAAYLDRLRFAKDKAEFDQFMAERWQRPPSAPDTFNAPDHGAPDPNAQGPNRPGPSRTD